MTGPSLASSLARRASAGGREAALVGARWPICGRSAFALRRGRLATHQTAIRRWQFASHAADRFSEVNDHRHEIGTAKSEGSVARIEAGR